MQAGKFSTWTLLPWSHAVIIGVASSFALFWLNMQDLPLKRHHLDGSISCSKACITCDSSALTVPFLMCKLQIHRHDNKADNKLAGLASFGWYSELGSLAVISMMGSCLFLIHCWLSVWRSKASSYCTSHREISPDSQNVWWYYWL